MYVCWRKASGGNYYVACYSSYTGVPDKFSCERFAEQLRKLYPHPGH